MTSPTNAQDVVAVLAANFTQVFRNARALKLTVSPESKAMEHPLETGALVTDHRILLPVSAELSMVVAGADYQAVYQQVSDLFRRGELLTVQTRVASFPSMLIEKIPHEESAEIFNGFALSVTLKEAKFVSPQFSTLPARKVARPKDSDTVKRGQQQPTTSNRSILSEWFGK